MKRREALQTLAGSLAAAALSGRLEAHQPESPPATGLGIVLYCRRHKQQLLARLDPGLDLFEPQRFLEEARRIGAGGIQADLGIQPADSSRTLRETAERYGMYIEGIVRLPRGDGDLERFARQMETAQQCGALAVRTVILSGRRYEQFHSLDEFQAAVEDGRKALKRAAPIAERYRIPLALENHKDQRLDERLALLEEIGSPYVGACVDTGNSVALLEDAVETARRLAPWAFSVHFKDQGLRTYPDGFLLGDVPLGQGQLDLPKILEVLKAEKPDLRFTLELITRDPLRVPCLTDAYWATMPQVPGRDLARTLRLARSGGTDPLPVVESLPLPQRVAREDANIQASVAFARETLRL